MRTSLDLKTALFLLVAAFGSPLTALAAEDPTPSPGSSDPYGWRLTADTKDGIRAYKRSVPGSKLLAFKGEGDLDVPLPKAFQVLFDTTRATEWIADLKQCRVVRQLSDFEYIEYDLVGTPPLIMKNREFVSRVSMWALPDRKTLVMRYAPALDPLVPPNNRFVRGELVWVDYQLTAIDGGRRTSMTAEVLCDPKGSVPKWLVNWFQKSWPLDTFRSMRRQALKPDIPDWPLYSKILKHPKRPPQR
jgi:hypothetical protein